MPASGFWYDTLLFIESLGLDRMPSEKSDAGEENEIDMFVENVGSRSLLAVASALFLSRT